MNIRLVIEKRDFYSVLRNVTYQHRCGSSPLLWQKAIYVITKYHVDKKCSYTKLHLDSSPKVDYKRVVVYKSVKYYRLT